MQISGATVLATSSLGVQKSSATNTQGQFNISVEPGTFTVNASVDGTYDYTITQTLNGLTSANGKVGSTGKLCRLA